MARTVWPLVAANADEYGFVAHDWWAVDLNPQVRQCQRCGKNEMAWDDADYPIDPCPRAGYLRRRQDGRDEVADERVANENFGCASDDWCILAAGHTGDCNQDREVWAGPDTLYPQED